MRFSTADVFYTLFMSLFNHFYYPLLNKVNEKFWWSTWASVTSTQDFECWYIFFKSNLGFLLSVGYMRVLSWFSFPFLLFFSPQIFDQFPAYVLQPKRRFSTGLHLFIDATFQHPGTWIKICRSNMVRTIIYHPGTWIEPCVHAMLKSRFSHLEGDRFNSGWQDIVYSSFFENMVIPVHCHHLTPVLYHTPLQCPHHKMCSWVRASLFGCSFRAGKLWLLLRSNHVQDHR